MPSIIVVVLVLIAVMFVFCPGNPFVEMTREAWTQHYESELEIEGEEE